jgi:NADH-quinone oxidoreductase subunit M
VSLYDIVLAIPLIGFFICIFTPADKTKSFALVISLITFILSLGLIPGVLSNPAQMTYVTDVQWISYPPIRYHVGIDGVSLWLIILSTLLTPVSVAISWRSIEKRPKEFYAFLLLLEFGVVGVFAALDLFLFYVFWEVALVPMYFLVGVWGHERRIYAAVKFFLYTMAASVLMLVAIIYLYNRAGTFDYVAILQMIQSGKLAFTPVESLLMFLAFFVAFAVKVPLFPLHTWLPDAHVEAPTAGSVMLASVMLKMGTYGILRFAVPMFPETARVNAGWIITLSIIGIIYGALVSLVQPNIKKLVAYSSVSHLGFVVLGIFSFTPQGLDGAVYQMLNHGISTGALFMLVGMLYERRHSLEIRDFGGVATPAPWLATVFLITTLASIGLPVLNNFVGEFLVLQGAAIANFSWAVFAAIGVILSACYMLWMYQRVFLGRAPGMAASTGHGHGHGAPHDPDTAAQADAHASHEHSGFHMPDLNGREWAALAPMVLLMIVMGIAAQMFLPSIGASNEALLQQVRPAQTRSEVARAH